MYGCIYVYLATSICVLHPQIQNLVHGDYEVNCQSCVLVLPVGTNSNRLLIVHKSADETPARLVMNTSDIGNRPLFTADASPWQLRPLVLRQNNRIIVFADRTILHRSAVGKLLRRLPDPALHQSQISLPTGLRFSMLYRGLGSHSVLLHQRQGGRCEL